MTPSNAQALLRERVVVGGNPKYHPARLLRIRRLGVRVPPSALHRCRSEGISGPQARRASGGVAKTWQERAVIRPVGGVLTDAVVPRRGKRPRAPGCGASITPSGRGISAKLAMFPTPPSRRQGSVAPRGRPWPVIGQCRYQGLPLGRLTVPGDHSATEERRVDPCRGGGFMPRFRTPLLFAAAVVLSTAAAAPVEAAPGPVPGPALAESVEALAPTPS